MIAKSWQYVKKYYFFMVTISVLFLVFDRNILRSVEKEHFKNFQWDSQSLVVGRMVRSTQDGIFSFGALLGWNHPTALMSDTLQWSNGAPPFNGPVWGYKVPGHMDKGQFQYDILEGQSPFESYECYFSNPGGQAAIYSIINTTFNIDPIDTTMLYKSINAFFSALVLGTMVFWIRKVFGAFAGCTSLIIICFSKWMVLFANDFFYVFGLFYLPFVAVLLYLHYAIGAKFYHQSHLLLLIISTVTLKCILAGFDFIIPTLVMAVLPLIFYGIYKQWGYKNTSILFTKASLFALGGVLLGLLVLSFQIGQVKGSLPDGINYVLSTFNRRTHGEGFVPQNISTMEIFHLYWNSKIVNLNHLINGATISIKHLVTLFLGCSCFMILWPHRFSYGQNMALISTLWISVIAPTAWFLVFKNHAYFHTHVDHIVWSMPFVILGMVLVAVTCQLVCKAVWQQIRPHFLSTYKHPDTL